MVRLRAWPYFLYENLTGVASFTVGFSNSNDTLAILKNVKIDGEPSSGSEVEIYPTYGQNNSSVFFAFRTRAKKFMLEITMAQPASGKETTSSFEIVRLDRFNSYSFHYINDKLVLVSSSGQPNWRAKRSKRPQGP